MAETVNTGQIPDPCLGWRLKYWNSPLLLQATTQRTSFFLLVFQVVCIMLLTSRSHSLLMIWLRVSGWLMQAGQLIQTTAPGQQLYKISILKWSHDYGHLKSIFLQRFNRLSAFICQTCQRQYHAATAALCSASRVSWAWYEACLAFDSNLCRLQGMIVQCQKLTWIPARSGTHQFMLKTWLYLLMDMKKNPKFLMKHSLPEKNTCRRKDDIDGYNSEQNYDRQLLSIDSWVILSRN